MLKRETLYFETPGKHNTKALLTLVKAYAEAEGIKDIVVASTTGETGVKASKLFKGLNVVVVTHFVGMKEPGVSEFDEENRKRILKNGAKIHTATHALSSAERAVRGQVGNHNAS